MKASTTSQGVDFIFIDDARQKTPSRRGMGPLVAAGCVIVPGENVGNLERALEDLCQRAGFPPGEEGEFKWSPKKTHWMYQHLKGNARTAFFREVLTTAGEHHVQVVVVVEDTQYRPASDKARLHEEDVVVLLAERVQGLMSARRRDGVVIADRPGGGHKGERSFLTFWEELLASGTRYMKMENLPLNALTQHSHRVRLLQLADLVTSCTTAMVAGEDQYAPLVFPHIRELMLRGLSGCISGYGLKIHPDGRYGYLYEQILRELGCK